ncbi:MAG: hypothetical protein Q9169_003008 [Polycauliona sp. 2 TL-2023]
MYIRFTEKNNIRLVIKSTGHDWLGKSTGKGALGLWTQHLKSPKVIAEYHSSYYNGPALKVGAGTLSAEALEAAAPASLRVVSGSCPSVGIAGGYTQGAGHSILSSSYGLGADQVLEWEVVTANGQRVVATPTQNTDLYFALSGGGPGTYGVVISMTVRAYQDGLVGGATLSFAAKGTTKEAYWKAITAWHTQLPALVDSGATALYLINPDGFLIAPITAPDKSVVEVMTMLHPFTRTLKSLNITYSVNTTSESTYLAHFTRYLGPLPYGSYPTAQLLGGRLVPRTVIENNNKGLTQAFREITENSTFYIAATALGVKKPKLSKPISHNAVLPAWREVLLSVFVASAWEFTAPRFIEEERQSQLTNSLIPMLTAVTPQSGTYMNEAGFQLASWKEDFYGANYARLRSSKAKYDPGDLFYATTAVGSDTWNVAADGRMCRAQS